MNFSYAREYNFDGLVGPTHNYAGLSVGNVASLENALGEANPKQAALEGLNKMRTLMQMGLHQGVIAPMERPDVHTLRRLGFTGTDAVVLQQAWKTAPELLIACSSASSMWTANACTVSPSADTADGRVHFTPANLANKFHRSIEHLTTGRILNAMFNDDSLFCHHPALPMGEHFGDEGAANHTRFCNSSSELSYGTEGIEFFVFGQYSFQNNRPKPKLFPARQSFEASTAISRIHLLNNAKTIIAQQNPEVIDQGVFHNDVIAVGNGNVLFCHEYAFLDQGKVYQELKAKFSENNFEVIEVKNSDVSLADCVNSYLFNSQLVTRKDGGMTLIAPAQCRSNSNVSDYLDALVSSEHSINAIKIHQVDESMKNGGGPACLRQRIVLTDKEQQAANQHVFLTESLYNELTSWVHLHYRDSIASVDLADPQLLVESRTALDQLTQIMQLGSVYPFQLEPTIS